MIYIAENKGKGSWIPEGQELSVFLIGICLVTVIIIFLKWRQR